MYWLITYSQKEKGYDEISATTVSDKHPGEWFADIVEKYPDIINKLLFAIEITKEAYDRIIEGHAGI